MIQLKEIFDKMKSTNSTGYHDISMKMLKNQKKSLLPLILKLTNRIIESKVFPSILKIQRIIPICKNNNFLDPDAY